MSSHPGFMTDWDLVHRWNWFRRDMWRQEFRTAVGGKGGGPTRAFAELAQMVGAQVLLDASCGLGKRAIHLAKEGAGIIGSDISENAILNAREFARSENAPVTFFRSPWNELPKNMPHHFDGALATGLSLEPSWDRLVAALAGLFQALHPGGFLMFAGAAETESPDGTR
ncbi:MAG: class I SAM-dependent methyltransferase, partial [Planctomycetes bacterium]|nr:class I SAM-dependent methyltransferase [Planctomycetota bacterium]